MTQLVLMRILGLEGTAHTISCGIVEICEDKVEILSNKKKMITTKEGGLTPTQIGEHHAEHIKDITKMALKEGKTSIKDINLISYSHGPGFGNGLNVVSIFAKTLSKKFSIPVVGVHHGAAHILIAKYLLNIKDGMYLYVSGGNTQIISLENTGFHVYGETEDIAIGNALDKLARSLGYGFPGGKIIEELAKKGSYFNMPYTVKGMDITLSGILTFAINSIGKHSNEDIAFSFQEHAFAMITETLERAMAYANKKEVCVVGGVALNERLQEMVKIMAEERGAKYYKLDKEFLGDNGAMIGVAGYHYHKYGFKGNVFKAKIKSRWRIEDAFNLE